MQCFLYNDHIHAQLHNKLCLKRLDFSLSVYIYSLERVGHILENFLILKYVYYLYHKCSNKLWATFDHMLISTHTIYIFTHQFVWIILK